MSKTIKDIIFKKRIRNFKKDLSLLFIGALLLLSFFLVLFGGNRFLYSYNEKRFIDETGRLSDYLYQELKGLQANSMDIVRQGKIIKPIEENNLTELISILEKEKNKREVGMIMATDKDGAVLFRTGSALRRGDFVLTTTPWGRLVKEGKEAFAIEADSFSPLVLVVGHPLLDNGQMVGALFIMQEVNDEYAAVLKNKYLDRGTQIAFYSKKDGIIGSSFETEKDKELIFNNFNPASDWIKDGANHKPNYSVELGEKKYFLDNVVFSGVDESPGGVLIFYPDGRAVGNIVSILIVVLIFSLVVLVYLYFKKKTARRIITTASIFFCFFLGAGILVNNFFITKWLEKQLVIKDSQDIIYNSTLSIEPQFSILKDSLDYVVAIKLSSGGEPINAARTIIEYDPKIIEVQEIITDNSFCKTGSFNMFIEKIIDNEKGEVIVSCGLPTPGFSGKNGTVAELLIKPLKSGLATMRINDESQVLANDGLGTNVLRAVTSASYTIVKEGEKVGDEIYKQVVIFSSSHPNSEQWYNKKKVSFSWQGEASEYIYSFDKNSISAPEKQHSTQNKQMDFEVSEDGIYYFHLAPMYKGIPGPINNYEVKIDTEAPLFSKIRTSDTVIKSGDVVRLEFEGLDEMSGLQSDYYYVQIDNSNFLPTKSPLYIPFMEGGRHKVIVRLFDNAGNINDREMMISVQGDSIINRVINIYNTW